MKATLPRFSCYSSCITNTLLLWAGMDANISPVLFDGFCSHMWYGTHMLCDYSGTGENQVNNIYCLYIGTGENQVNNIFCLYTGTGETRPHNKWDTVLPQSSLVIVICVLNEHQLAWSQNL